MSADHQTIAAERGSATVDTALHPRHPADPGTTGELIRVLLAEAVLDAIDHQVAVLTADGTVLAVNEAWQRFATLNGAPWVGVGEDYRAAITDAVPAGGGPGVSLAALIDDGLDRVSCEYELGPPAARTFFRMSATRHEVAGAEFVVMRHDPRTEAHEDRSAISLRSELLDQVDVAVIATDAVGSVRSWNAGAVELFGWSAEEAIGCDLVALLAPVGREAQGRLITERVRTQGRFEGQIDLATRSGATRTVEARYRLLDCDEQGLVLVAVDASERLAMERRVVQANQRLRTVTERMGEGLVTLDPDGRITYVNPHGRVLLGGEDGRYLGGSFVNRLVGIAADGSPAPREQQLIGDDFDGALPTEPTEDLLLQHDGGQLPIEYVASPLTPGSDADDGWVVVFRDISARRARDQELEERAEHARWMEIIDEALRGEHFTVFAQPIVELASGQVMRHELLLRLDHPTLGLLTPDRFLPTAERFGLIATIDALVLRRGLALAAAGMGVEINVSARTIDGGGFGDLVGRELQRTGVEPGMLGFELTETALLTNDREARRFAEQVRAYGCRIALDDFGTGYGGLSYLKQLPVDTLKIDREFVRDALVDPASRRVLTAVVGLAEAFDLLTVAEGVEDEATAELLRSLGVQHAQGYHFGRPGPTLPPIVG
ncbi:MAG: EAL domain-containing protein [Nitriliruptoraceae bacterium]|nr:EAL domain-containing protein [Nitriliruptoraceae bacterium]